MHGLSVDDESASADSGANGFLTGLDDVDESCISSGSAWKRTLTGAGVETFFLEGPLFPAAWVSGFSGTGRCRLRAGSAPSSWKGGMGG